MGCHFGFYLATTETGAKGTPDVKEKIAASRLNRTGLNWPPVESRGERPDSESLWGQTGPGGFSRFLLFCILTAFQEPRGISGNYPPLLPTPRRAASPLRGSGPDHPWSTVLPLLSLRFPIKSFTVSLMTSDPLQMKRKGSGSLRSRCK